MNEEHALHGIAPKTVSRDALAELERDARQAGHAIVRLDLGACRDKAGLLACAAAAFRFPHWFGHNWDALADALGDLSWLPAPGYLVELVSTEALRSSDPASWRMLCEILQEVSESRAAEEIPWRAVTVRSIRP